MVSGLLSEARTLALASSAVTGEILRSFGYAVVWVEDTLDADVFVSLFAASDGGGVVMIVKILQRSENSVGESWYQILCQKIASLRGTLYSEACIN